MMSAGFVNIVKLCVGEESVESHIAWIADRKARTPGWQSCHVTRMWPRREAEVLNGGSLYWVIKGLILCRQRLIGLEARRGTDGIERCALLLDDEVIRTEPMPRRAFQGWRYLEPGDSPRDLALARRGDDSLPEPLALELARIGLR
ncbi:MAG: DUF1489 domain-containing protein [Paracoccaceae bacterium]|jgi:hypothetical protein